MELIVNDKILVLTFKDTYVLFDDDSNSFR